MWLVVWHRVSLPLSAKGSFSSFYQGDDVWVLIILLPDLQVFEVCDGMWMYSRLCMFDVDSRKV
jgi:hypothetical protein